jgi:hypothetical protein
MAKTITVDGVDRTTVIRLDTITVAESGWRGAPELSGLDLDDPAAAIFFNGHRPVLIAEGSNRLFTGYTWDRNFTRGPFRVNADGQKNVELVDLNTLFDDRILDTSSFFRPAETDVARVLALVASGELGTVDTSLVPHTNTVALDAGDYRGKHPRDLMNDVVDASGKNYTLFDHGNGRQLYYDLPTNANYATSLRLSTVLADVDNVTTFAPEFPTLGRVLSPDRVYAKVRVDYDGGTVSVTNPTTATTFRSRETAIYEGGVTTKAAATVKANQFLAEAATEEDTIECVVGLPAALITAIRPAQRILVKFPHLGIADFTAYRVLLSVVAPRGKGERKSDIEYDQRLTLSIPKVARWTSKPKAPGSPPSGAAIECAGGGTTSQYRGVYYRDGPEGNAGYGTTGLGTGGRVGSAVYYNVPYTASNCPIGGGFWTATQTMELWYQFTAPADTGQIGMRVSIDGETMWNNGSGYRGGWEFRIYPAAPSALLFAQGYHVAIGGITSNDFFIDRSLVTWGAVNSFILHPLWRAGGEFCNLTANFENPEDDGRGSSGKYGVPGLFLTYTVCDYIDGAIGLSPWIGGRGAVDGSNRTYTLLDWSGSGSPEARVNGIDIPREQLTYNTSALTVTLPYAPGTGDEVQFRYAVVE